MDDETVSFPDGRSAEIEVSAADMATVENRLCVKCGGEAKRMGAHTYTVARCPKCETLHPGEPVQ